eukprot:PITA_05289
MGDDGRYNTIGIGTISFERESGKPFVLKEVMHVPGVKKNLISVAMLEDKGYDDVFSEAKAFLRIKSVQGCTLGKFVKATFHEKDSRATTILERIHTDVCGPFSVASIEKHKYYVIFIDDFSRKCWIFFMQKKSETYSKFCEFKALVEKESGKKVKPLGSDNGGEIHSGKSLRILQRRRDSKRASYSPITHNRNGVC